MRLYPGRDRCEKYDPRSRPWYVAASSGFFEFLTFINKIKKT